MDIIVVGAGMAGASVGFEASTHASVVLLEREEQPGYHSTGRSAAAFIPSYGHNNPALRSLTLASRAFLEHPASGFSPVALLRERGLLTVGGVDSEVAIRAEHDQLASTCAGLQLLHHDEILAKVPALRGELAHCALFEPEVFDIDVDALHQAYLRGLRARGGELRCAVQIKSIVYRRGQYHVASNIGDFTAPLLVNASGAWADELAAQAGVAAIGLQPLRRTAVLIDPPPGVTVDNWPLLLAQDESFYAKPDAGALLVSPVDEHPSPPVDARPEELDIAYAVHHIQQALQIEHPRVRHSWAGLRCFVADRTPVIGFDPGQQGFFWLCSQGGHGIQTAPASARLAASLLLGEPLPRDLNAKGVSPDMLAPARLSEVQGQTR